MALDFPNSPSVNDSFSAGGKTWVYNGTKWVLLSVSLNQTVADGAITTSKIADSAITASKIADGTIVAAEIANNAITTAKILDANVTQAKLGTTLSAVTVTTAANRDTAVASPFTGQLVFLTDTKKIQVWDGTSWLNITLAPPETPTSLSATALSTTSVSIAFTAGGANGSAITNYKYALSTNSGSTYGSFVAVDPADITTPITISGLTAATAYYIKLKAVNDMGDSVASAAVSISTLATPDAPTSLSAGSITATSVAISFTPGSDNGYAISNYQYALSTDSGSTYGSFTALATPDATSPITISGLTADTAYYVKLKGVNSSGAGSESSAVSFSTIPPLTVDYLVVAGAGGGGVSYGGGGGAGGLRSTVTNTGGGGSLESALTLAPSTNYTVVIGAGGQGGGDVANNAAYIPGSGTNSEFSTIISVGGGRGSQGHGTQSPLTGGSGGGGGDGSQTGAAGTANQGFAGGNYNGTGGGGGGGGAGAVGGNASSESAGNGGVGVAVAITGSSVYYAGGGGGTRSSAASSSGGLGGGGAGNTAGNNSGAATPGTANTGGGGGAGGHGGGSAIHGKSGGSGVVILRYASAYTITLGAGLTGTESAASGGYKRATITAGSGNVSWA